MAVTYGWVGAWASHFVHSPFSGQICQLWDKLSQQAQLGAGLMGLGWAGLGRAIFKGLWRHGTVLIRERARPFPRALIGMGWWGGWWVHLPPVCFPC